MSTDTNLSYFISELKRYKLTALSVTTPANNAAEHERFIASTKSGRLYVPDFQYKTAEYDKAVKAKATLPNLLNKMEDTFSKQNGPQRFIYELIRIAIQRQLAICDIAIAVHEHDDTEAKRLLEIHYGKISEELLELANTIAKGASSIPNYLLDETPRILMPDQVQYYGKEKYGAYDIGRVFQTALDVHSLSTEWNIAVDNSRGNITVRVCDENYRHIVVVPPTKEYNPIKVIQLAMHEIATHVRHNTNCYSILMDECGLSEPDASLIVELALESPYTEGLAKVADAIAFKACYGNDSGAPHPWHVLAVDMASKGANFIEVADFLLKNSGRDAEECWKITQRAFRGCSNLNENPHGFANPSGITYLRDYIDSVSHYKDRAIFNFAKFNPEVIALHKAVSGIPLSSVRPKVVYRNDCLGMLIDSFCPAA